MKRNETKPKNPHALAMVRARVRSQSKSRRSQIAKAAAKVRWAKHKRGED